MKLHETHLKPANCELPTCVNSAHKSSHERELCMSIYSRCSMSVRQRDIRSVCVCVREREKERMVLCS